MKTGKLLIIGDSLSMSRHGEGIDYEQMYASHLALAYPGRLVVNASERANTSRRIASAGYQHEYLLPMSPNVVVLQIGVVDCLPRLFSDLERRLVNRASKLRLTRGLADAYVSYRSDQRLERTRKRPLSLIPEAEFRLHMSALQQQLTASGCRQIVINIPCPGPALTTRSHGADEFARRFNEILRETFSSPDARHVDLYRATREKPSLLLEDGYHINGEAHLFLFEQAKAILDEWGF